MTADQFPDTDAYFYWQGQQEAAELRRNPKIDPTLLMPWAGIFRKEKSCPHTVPPETV